MEKKKSVEEQIWESDLINASKRLGKDFEDVSRMFVEMNDVQRNITLSILSLKLLGGLHDEEEAQTLAEALMHIVIRDEEFGDAFVGVLCDCLTRAVKKNVITDDEDER